REPAQRRLDGAPPEWSRAQALPALEGVVHADEEILPNEAFRRERAGDARKAEARVLTRHGPKLIEPARLRQPHDGLGVHEDEKGPDDRARTVGNFAKIEQG